MINRIPHIFLSYAREDFERVLELYDRLHATGFKPWIDKRDILPGEKWEHSIWKAVRRSDFFLICLSANSVSKRGFLQKEVREALNIWKEKLDDDIYLIPVRLDECEIPAALSEFEWVNMYEEQGWYRLIEAISVGVERSSQPYRVQTPSGEIRVRTETISESKLDKPRYRIDIGYPQIEGPEDNIAKEINVRIYGYILSTVHHFRRSGINHSQYIEDEWWSELASYLSASYRITFLTDRILSMAFGFSEYGAGAAHSQERTAVFNYLLRPLLPIELYDLFKTDHSPDYLQVISDFCIKTLTEQFENEVGEIDEYSLDSIRQGASPDYDNFLAFSLTPTSVKFTFDPYKVGSYAWHTREVEIPFDHLKDIIDWKSPVLTAITS